MDGGGHPDTWLQALLHELKEANEASQKSHQSLSSMRSQLIAGLLGGDAAAGPMRAALLDAQACDGRGRSEHGDEVVVEVHTV